MKSLHGELTLHVREFEYLKPFLVKMSLAGSAIDNLHHVRGRGEVRPTARSVEKVPRHFSTISKCVLSHCSEYQRSWLKIVQPSLLVMMSLNCSVVSDWAMATSESAMLTHSVWTPLVWLQSCE